MAYTIAFSGKGGTGKTTLAGLTVRYIMERTGKPILAVDADSNACLHDALGARVHATIGAIRESSLETVRSGARLGGMSTEEIFDYQVQQCIVEEKGFDLLVMGRPEGPGCYCAANNIIRKYTDKLSGDYKYVVIDNEAGMEHLSRRTAHEMDVLFVVSDPTVKGIKTARRINDLVDELGLQVKHRCFVINRVKGDTGEVLRAAARELSMEPVGMIPEDETVFRLDIEGKPVFGISADAVSYRAVYAMLDTVLQLEASDSSRS